MNFSSLLLIKISRGDHRSVEADFRLKLPPITDKSICISRSSSGFEHYTIPTDRLRGRSVGFGRFKDEEVGGEENERRKKERKIREEAEEERRGSRAPAAK